MYLLDSLQTKERKYYVYRFLNKDKVKRFGYMFLMKE